MTEIIESKFQFWITVSILTVGIAKSELDLAVCVIEDFLLLPWYNDQLHKDCAEERGRDSDGYSEPSWNVVHMKHWRMNEMKISTMVIILQVVRLHLGPSWTMLKKLTNNVTP